MIVPVVSLQKLSFHLKPYQNLENIGTKSKHNREMVLEEKSVQDFTDISLFWYFMPFVLFSPLSFSPLNFWVKSTSVGIRGMHSHLSHNFGFVLTWLRFLWSCFVRPASLSQCEQPWSVITTAWKWLKNSHSLWDSQ